MEMQDILELTDSEKIKLYMNRYKTAETVEKKTMKRGEKKTVKSSITYSVTLSSGLDAVIDRKEKDDMKQLIIMPSQNKYLFKQGEVVQDVKTTTIEEFSLFFNAIPENGIFVNNIILSSITNQNFKTLWEMIRENEAELHEGLLSLDLYKSGIHKSLREDKKLWKLIVTKTPILTNQSKYDMTFVRYVFDFNKERGYDAARTFVEHYTKSSMKAISGYRHYMYRQFYYSSRENNYIIAMKSLDTKRLVEYLCFDLYSQGFEEIPVGIYEDYLKMCMLYDEKVKDKYPVSLLTEHDIISLKCDLKRKEIDQRNFDEAYANLKSNFKLENNVIFSYKDLSMMLPNNSNDLIDEGQKLGHCVGSYIQRVASKECVILFVRKKHQLNESYLTVEIRPMNDNGKPIFYIAQIQGDSKRTTLTKDEKNFFTEFMDKSGFKTNNKNFEGKYRI